MLDVRGELVGHKRAISGSQGWGIECSALMCVCETVNTLHIANTMWGLGMAYTRGGGGNMFSTSPRNSLNNMYMCVGGDMHLPGR